MDLSCFLPVVCQGGMEDNWKFGQVFYTDASTDYSTELFPVLPQALSTYGSDSQMTSLLNQMDVYVLPVFNIDGYDYTHKSVCYNFKPKIDG